MITYQNGFVLRVLLAESLSIRQVGLFCKFTRPKNCANLAFGFVWQFFISRSHADNLADGFGFAIGAHAFFLPSWRVGSFGEFRRPVLLLGSAAASQPAIIPRRDARTIAHNPFLQG